VAKLVCKEFPIVHFPSPTGQFGAMIPLVKNLEKACFNAKCVFLAKIHHHCEIKKKLEEKTLTYLDMKKCPVWT